MRGGNKLTEWSDLSESQKTAVRYRDGPLLIIAGPGSGKTEVLACRVAYLIRARIAKPDNILVATFADKAAVELKDRIQEKIPHVNIEMTQVSTIHSFCLKLLHKYHYHIDTPADFKILGELEQLLFILSHHEELGFGDVLGIDPYGFLAEVKRIFNLATEELVEPFDLEDWCWINLENCGEDSEKWREWSLIASAYDRYLGLLHDEGVLDFASIQSCALRLLENILTFQEKFPNAAIIKLEQNFRSKKAIVHNSQQVITHNSTRIPKALTSVRGIGSDVLIVYERNFTEEARASVNLLKRLHNAGKIANHGDIAVLLRSAEYHAMPYIMALRESNIPFSVTGDGSFFKRIEISALCDLFRFLNVTGKGGDHRYLNNSLFGFIPETCNALEKNDRNLIEFSGHQDMKSIGIMDANDQQRLMTLINLKHKVQNGNHNSMLAVFYELLRCTNCTGRFEKDSNLNSMVNLGLLSRLIAAWDEYGGTCDIKSFLKFIDALKQGGVDQITIPPKDAIQIMSIHQAKGLEFQVILMGSVVNGRLPNCQRLEAFNIPYDMRASGMPEVENPHLVDERKLFYVAATRARDLLIIGTSDAETICDSGPSIFLKEMFGEDLEAVADLTKGYVEKVESKPCSRQTRMRHSFSKLSHFLQCPMRYKYAVIYDFRMPWSESGGFGDNVHRALEEIHHKTLLEGRLPTDNEVAKIVKDKWVTVNLIDQDQENSLIDAAVEQINRYLNEHCNDLSMIVQAETSFSFDLNGQIIQGSIDLLKRDGKDSIEIIDFKTYEMTPDDEEIRTNNIDFQLDIYALGAERALRQEVAKTTVHFLKEGKLLTTKWSSERRNDALTRLTDILDDISNGQYSPNLDYCAYCQEFKELCPYGAAYPRKSC